MLLVPIFYILSYLKSKSLSHLWDFGTVHTAAILIASIVDTCLQEQVLSGSVEAAALRDFGSLEPSIRMESCVPLPGHVPAHTPCRAVPEADCTQWEGWHRQSLPEPAQGFGQAKILMNLGTGTHK